MELPAFQLRSVSQPAEKQAIVRVNPTPMASSAWRRRSPSRLEHAWPAASTGTRSADQCWRSSAWRLYSHLQLLTPTFTDFNVEDALGEPKAIVVAEKVLHVTSANWPPWHHVDFFHYNVNGDVVRSQGASVPLALLSLELASA